MAIIAEKKSDRFNLKKTRSYEMVLLYRSNISSVEIQQDLTALFSFISSRCFGGVTICEYWGLRPISYEILGNKKAHYYYVIVEMGPDFIKELDFRIRTNPNVIRKLILRTEVDVNINGESKFQSVMMKNLPGDIEKEMGEIQCNDSFIYKF